jgi:hypothetical protein
MLKVIRAGLYTSVQDGGRIGLRQSGISYCGALDKPALQIANLLVGNSPDAAALEITLGQCSFEFEQDGWFALTGAGCDARLDDAAVWTGWRLPVKAGQRLTLKRPLHGMRSYLAIGGFFAFGNRTPHRTPFDYSPQAAHPFGANATSALFYAFGVSPSPGTTIQKNPPMAGFLLLRTGLFIERSGLRFSRNWNISSRIAISPCGSGW